MFYAVYDLQDNYVISFENYPELSKWFGKTIRGMTCAIHRLRKGEVDTIINKNDNQKYRIYIYEVDDV